ncbi:MAG: hypothetical protein ABEJ07_02060 [Candidatus Nanohaloarchaea archaeon]
MRTNTVRRRYWGEVGELLDSRIKDMLESSDATVTGYLDAVFPGAGEPRYDPALSYQPPGFIDEVEVDDVNGFFRVRENESVHRYWIPYVEDETVCVFTDYFVSGSDPLEGVRFPFDGDMEHVPEVSGNPQLKHHVARMYEAIEDYVAEEWGLSFFGQEVTPPGHEFSVDISSVEDEFFEMRESDPELFEQTADKI